MRISSKKGQVSAIPPSVTILVIAAFLLVMGLIITQSMTDTINDVPATVTNESGGYINTTGYTLGQASACNFNSPSITTIYNATNGVVILSGNYTISSAGVLTNVSTDSWSSVNITYSYEHGDQACTDATSTVTGLGTFADFMEIIILAIIATVVIGLLLSAFAGRSTR